MSMLFQAGVLFTDLTVFENVAFPVREDSKLPEPLLRSNGTDEVGGSGIARCGCTDA